MVKGAGEAVVVGASAKSLWDSTFGNNQGNNQGNNSGNNQGNNTWNTGKTGKYRK